MNNHFKYIIFAIVLSVMGPIAIVRAQADNRSMKTNEVMTQKAETKVEARTEQVKAKGDSEIQKRVAKLNQLMVRLSEMKNLSPEQKNQITTTLQAVIKHMNDLDVSLAAATSTAQAKLINQSIAQDYRVYALVIPEYTIIAAADRIITVSDMIAATALKFEARLTSTASSTMTEAQKTELANVSAKIASAKASAQAAVDSVSSLVPDMGDKTVLASNTAALKEARAKVRAAQTDLVSARKSLGNLLKLLPKMAEVKSQERAKIMDGQTEMTQEQERSTEGGN